MTDDMIDFKCGSSDFRGRELRWRETHQKELSRYAGQYVVLEETRIIAYDRDLAKAINEARGKGIEIPFVFYVPTEEENNTIFIGCD